MKFDFDFTNIKYQELIVALEDPFSYSQLMVDASVQACLTRMLEDTASRFDEITYNEIPRYEFAEKYSTEELVRASLALYEFANLKNIFEMVGVDQNSNPLDEINRVSYYLYRVIDSNNKKLVAIRKAQQFKGLASARGRLISWMDDSLTIMDKPVFRLDRDFDLIITSTEVFAVRPTTLAYVAEVDEAATAAASQRLIEIGKSINFLALEKLKSYVSTHKRGAHLVSSISARDDLKKFNKIKLESACSQLGIQLESVGDEQLGPMTGYELQLLELLDNRRYMTSLTEDAPKVFVATSRKSVK